MTSYNVGLIRWRRGQITDEDLTTDVEQARAVTGNPGLAAYLQAQVHAERGDLDSARQFLGQVGQELTGQPET